MTNFIETYKLWGPFAISCFLIFTYHFQIVLVRYKTYGEIKGKHYTKEEVEEKLEKLELKLETHITDKELQAFEKFIDLRFDNMGKLLENISKDVSDLTGLINKSSIIKK